MLGMFLGYNLLQYSWACNDRSQILSGPLFPQRFNLILTAEDAEER